MVALRSSKGTVEVRDALARMEAVLQAVATHQAIAHPKAGSTG